MSIFQNGENEARKVRAIRGYGCVATWTPGACAQADRLVDCMCVLGKDDANRRGRHSSSRRTRIGTAAGPPPSRQLLPICRTTAHPAAAKVDA